MQTQRAIILSGVREFIGSSVNVQVFGSRLDDTKRGGDVVLLLIPSTAIPLLASQITFGLVSLIGIIPIFWRTTQQ